MDTTTRESLAMPSPVGWLTLSAEDGAVIAIDFVAPSGSACLREPPGDKPSSCMAPVLVEAGRQLDAYFAGDLRDFDLPLGLHGTPFQLAVWAALCSVPYGQTVSYAELARRVGRPGAARAVGRANGQNPVAIVVPCHRVIGADGRLTGYAGGIDAKAALLALESDTGNVWPARAQ